MHGCNVAGSQLTLTSPQRQDPKRLFVAQAEYQAEYRTCIGHYRRMSHLNRSDVAQLFVWEGRGARGISDFGS